MTQTWELSDTDFKITMMTTLKNLMGKLNMDLMNQMGT